MAVPFNYFLNYPAPPGMDQWDFVKDYKAYPRQVAHWDFSKAIPAGHADLSGGIALVRQFDDPESLLDTAYDDFLRFCDDVNLSSNGSYAIIAKCDQTEKREAFSISVCADQCQITASDTEGIRHALYYLQGMILENHTPAIAMGTVNRQPFITLRMTRGFHSPKNRPSIRRDDVEHRADYELLIRTMPEFRDELLDDVDYYPDAYLSRLARDGVNAIWITSSFRELCHSDVIPEYGCHSEQRVAKLNRVIEKCRRWGIAVFVFVVEPRGFGDSKKSAPMNVLKNHPELAGTFNRFCTSTDTGRAYLDEATYRLFASAPKLAGLVNLCIGEMPTHCYSSYLELGTCPRCSKRDPGEVLGEVLKIMSTAMKRANSNAKLIAWPYSQYIVWGEQKTIESVQHIPEDVAIQYNFESRGRTKQLGKTRTLDDYWLAWPGPSELFKTCAQNARARGLQVSAKLQLGCAYELCTVPYVPVPGIVYDKYRAMRKLGVSTVMHCWLIGGAPSLMHKAACLLSFEPFPRSRQEFLRDLAQFLWPAHAETMAQAWEHFEAGYRNYPFSRAFSYYSPLNAGPTWPLYLIPRDTPLSVPYVCGWPANGDRIGECLMDDLTLEEAITLCSRMLISWNKGLALLEEIAPYYTEDIERTKDIGIARTVGILIQSCVNILTFYHKRDAMAYEEDSAIRLKVIDELEAIVHHERRLSEKLITLCQSDSRIGFQSDAEHHIVYPEKIQWRIGMLDALLADEFGQVRRQITDGQDPFAAFTGKQPGPKVYVAPQDSIKRATAVYCEDLCVYGGISGGTVSSLDTVYGRETLFRSCWDDHGLVIEVTCMEPDLMNRPTDATDRDAGMILHDDYVAVHIEPKRGYPSKRLLINPAGSRCHQVSETPMNYEWAAKVHHLPWIGGWGLSLFRGVFWVMSNVRVFPFDSMSVGAFDPGLMMVIFLRLIGTSLILIAPLRLLLGDMNPKNMAWLVFE